MAETGSDSRHRLLPLLVLAVAALSAVLGCDGMHRRGGGGDADGFHQGRKLVTEGRFDAALPLLEGYLRDAPRGRFASRASFFVAKAHLGLGDLDAAAAQLEATVRAYPESLEAHKSRYKLAIVDWLAGRHDEARSRFAELAASPDGPLVPEAVAMQRFLSP